jgi:isovaleryl-CoA dehydrogenase
MPSQRRYAHALDRVIRDVVEPGAAEVDAAGAFPRSLLGALAQAGLLGLTVPADLGGGGGGLREAAAVIRELGMACGSTAMVMTMHYSATSALVAAGDKETLTEIAAGRHLSTLAFSESGSRSHFWAPLGTAVGQDGTVRLDAHKSWVTSAGQADSYVWSSRPLAGEGPMTLWLVPSGAEGLTVSGVFDGWGCGVTRRRR